MKHCNIARKTVSFFGHFGSTNFGNEATFQTILYHLRRARPDIHITCICTNPETVTNTYHVSAVSLSPQYLAFWSPSSAFSRFLRTITIGLLSEFYRCIRALLILRHSTVLIIPGTGLLTDAYGFRGWGPYNLFKWSLLAKLCGCKLLFVSVGAGPFHSILGRMLCKYVLSFSDYRSYRDGSTKNSIISIGFCANSDYVYPDLVFSLPETTIPRLSAKKRPRLVIGIGLMLHAGRYGTSRPETQKVYLNNLVIFAKWLLAHEYDIRLITTELADIEANQEFKCLLMDQAPTDYYARIIDEPARSVEGLLSQIAATDMIVATRFHNIVLALLCGKPTIAISFHHKCASLMGGIGLAQYCIDISCFNCETLIDKFINLKANADKITCITKAKIKAYNDDLSKQYNAIFDYVAC